METEIWKDILGFEGLYQISNLGRVKTLKREVIRRNGRKTTINEIIRKPKNHKHNYYMINLIYFKKHKVFMIHRLVAIAFIPNTENKPFVNHKNGIKTDNRVDNLEWCTNGENIKHAHKIGLIIPSRGEQHRRSRFTNEQILEIRELINKITEKEIAEIYKCNPNIINKIIHRKTWKHI